MLGCAGCCAKWNFSGPSSHDRLTEAEKVEQMTRRNLDYWLLWHLKPAARFPRTTLHRAVEPRAPLPHFSIISTKRSMHVRARRPCPWRHGGSRDAPSHASASSPETSKFLLPEGERKGALFAFPSPHLPVPLPLSSSRTSTHRHAALFPSFPFWSSACRLSALLHLRSLHI